MACLRGVHWEVQYLSQEDGDQPWEDGEGYQESRPFSCVEEKSIGKLKGRMQLYKLFSLIPCVCS